MDTGFKKATSTDHRSWLWVTTILSIIYTVSILLARLFGKWGLLWFDDATLGLAYCIAAVRWGMQMRAISEGLGARLIVAGAIQQTAQYAFAARVLLMICLYFSKLSIVVFIRKVFSGNLNHENAIFAGAYSVVAVFGVASVLDVSISCHAAQYSGAENQHGCSENAARSVVLCLLDVVSELLIMLIPVLLLSKLQMQQSKKRAVYSVFALRAGVPIFGIAQAIAYKHFLSRDDGGSIGLVPTLVLQELWLMYSFISATIPCMRSFLGAFHTPYLTGAGSTQHYGHASSAGRNYQLSTLRRGQDATSAAAGKQDTPSILSNSQFRPDRPQYKVDIRHEGRGRAGDEDSLASDASEQMIITRATHIHVEEDREDGGSEGAAVAGRWVVDLQKA